MIMAKVMAELHNRLEEIDADVAPARAATILAGLGFSSDPSHHLSMHKPCGEFSGGWRQRISLAIALFISPEVMLLDEPTNHLDVTAVLWLEKYLQSWTDLL